MATLELAVDARPMQRGAQEATQALDGLGKAAQRTTDAIQGVFAARQDTSGRAVDGLRFNYATLQEQVAKTTETVRFNYATMQDEIVKTTVLVDKNAGAFSGFGQAVSRSVQPLEQSALRSRQAIESVGQSAQKTTAQLRNAFQATGGSIQVAGGIAQTAKAFADLNVAAAAFGSSRALLEVGKTVQDFRELTNTTQEVVRSYQVLESVGDGLGTKTLRTINETVQVSVGRWSALGAIIKANPLLTVATALGAVGSLMQVFTGQTDKAAQAVQGFNEELQKLSRQRQAAEILGIAGPAAGASLGAIRGIAEQTTAGGLRLGPAVQGTDLAREAAGLAADILRQREFRDAFTEAALRQFSETGAYTRVAPTRMGVRQETISEVPDVRLTQQEAQRLITDLYRQQAARAETEAQVAKVTADARKAAIEYERQQLQQSEKAAESITQDFERAAAFGSQISDGFFNAFQKITGGMELVSRVRQSLRQPSQTVLAEAAQSYDQQLQFRRGLTQQLPGAQQRLESYQARQAAEVPMAPLPPAVAPGQAPYYLGGAQATGVVEFGAAGPEGGALQQSAMESARLQAEADRRSVEASEKVAQNMQLAADYAGNIGGQLGSAFADVLMKTTTMRQAFSSIVASIARQSLADVGAGILRGAVGGMTARQTGQNVGVSP